MTRQRLLAIVPVAPALLVSGSILLVTPSYFAPLLNPAGLLAIISSLGLTGLAYWLSGLALARLRSRRSVSAGLMFAGAFTLTLPVLLIVLLAPAVFVVAGSLHK
jgi:hypothetical protein